MGKWIDISHVGQPNLTAQWFKDAAAAGIEGVWVKAGGADDGLYQDPKHDTYVAWARAAGLAVGHYWFNGNAVSVPEQAYKFMVYARAVSGDRVCWDVESENGVVWSPQDVLTANATVRGAGWPTPDVYLNEAEVTGVDWSPVKADGSALWEAAYIDSSPDTGVWGAYTQWQFTDDATIDGVAVDESTPGSAPDTSIIGGSAAPTEQDDEMAFHVLRQANGTTFALSPDLIIYEPGPADENINTYLRGGQQPWGLSEIDFLRALYRVVGLSETLAPWPSDGTYTKVLDSVLPSASTTQYTRQLFTGTTPTLLKYS